MEFSYRRSPWFSLKFQKIYTQIRIYLIFTEIYQIPYIFRCFVVVVSLVFDAAHFHKQINREKEQQEKNRRNNKIK